MQLRLCTHCTAHLHTAETKHGGTSETEADIKDVPLMKRTRKPPGVVTTLTAPRNARIFVTRTEFTSDTTHRSPTNNLLAIGIERFAAFTSIALTGQKILKLRQKSIFNVNSSERNVYSQVQYVPD
jgi:hypothetical protein